MRNAVLQSGMDFHKSSTQLTVIVSRDYLECIFALNGFKFNPCPSLYDAVYGANGLDIGDKLVQLGHASAAEMTLVDLDNDQTTVAASKVGGLEHVVKVIDVLASRNFILHVHFETYSFLLIKVHTSCPLKVSPDKMKTFEAINKVWLNEFI